MRPVLVGVALISMQLSAAPLLAGFEVAAADPRVAVGAMIGTCNE